MSKKYRKLTEFATDNNQQSTETTPSKEVLDTEAGTLGDDTDSSSEGSESSGVCDCYHEMREKYNDRINELGITPPKCGHCIAFLCNKNAGTAETYNGNLRIFIDWLHQQGICIKDLDFVDVRDYFEFRDRQGRSKSTIMRDRVTIKGVIGRFEAEAKQFPVISWKISQNIDPGDYSNGSVYERDPLEEEEINKLLSSVDDIRNKLMIVLTIETGARNEATNLIKISDVNLVKKEIELKNTKSGGTYVIPLSDSLVVLLEYWIENERQGYLQSENNEYLFPSRHGSRNSGDNFCQIVRKAAMEAGIQEKIGEIPVTERQKEAMNIDKDYRIKWSVDVHALRHTFKQLLENDGISKPAIRYAMDHSTDVTDDYGEENPEKYIKEIRENFDGVDISVL